MKNKDQIINEILKIAYKANPKGTVIDGNILLESHIAIQKLLDSFNWGELNKPKVFVSNSELLERAKEEVAKTRKGLTFERMNFLHGDYWIDEDIVNKVAIRFSQLSKEEDAVGLAKYAINHDWIHVKEDEWYNMETGESIKDTELYNIYKLTK